MSAPSRSAFEYYREAQRLYAAAEEMGPGADRTDSLLAATAQAALATATMAIYGDCQRAKFPLNTR